MLYSIFAGSRATKATANQTIAVMKQEDMKKETLFQLIFAMKDSNWDFL